MSRLLLAVDVGGGTIKAELVTAAGEIRARRDAPTPHGQDAWTAIADAGAALLDQAGGAAAAAGVVVPGLVDADAGTASYSANIGWRDLPLAALLSERWRLPVRIGNDVASAGVAELRSGAGAGHEHVAFVVIGTGIAAALVSGGRLLTGPGGEIAEIGHLRVRSEPRCGCGAEGCLEAVASAGAIARRYADRAGQPVAGAREVAERLDSDPVARQVWEEAAEALADGLATLATVVRPEVIVVGGGLSVAGETLLAPVRAALARRPLVVDHPVLVTSRYAARAGVVGAAMLAHDGWRAER